MATSEAIAPLPRLTLTGGMQIVFEAIDPTTGLAVAGVVVSQVAIYSDSEELPAGESISVTLPDTPPLWAPTPAEAADIL